MAKARRKLKDLLIDLIALVKSPASTFTFAVIKSAKGGEEKVDEILQLVQELCAGESFEGLEKAAIPEDKLAAVKDSLTTLKSVTGDLPDNVQSAIKVLARIAGYGYTAQEKSAEAGKNKEDSSGLLPLLAEIREQVVNADKKFDVMVEDTQKARGDIQKSMEELTTRLSKLEKATGVEKSKGAEEVGGKKVEKEAEKDLWEDAIPGQVML